MTFPRKMLACIDSAESFNDFKHELGWTARRLRCGLVLFHSRPARLDEPVDAPDYLLEILDDDRFDELAADDAITGVEVEVRSVRTDLGLPDAIHEGAERFGADLVVVPTHARRGLDRMVFGSVAERVVRGCKTPVLTLDLERVPHTKEDAAFDRIIVPTDFSEVSLKALGPAASLAGRFGCGITLFHAVEEYYTSAVPIGGVPYVESYLPQIRAGLGDELRRIAEEKAGELSVEIDAMIEIGGLLPTIEEATSKWSNSMVVLSTAGRDSLGDHLLGSRAERMIRAAHGSVLSLPAAFLAR